MNFVEKILLTILTETNQMKALLLIFVALSSWSFSQTTTDEDLQQLWQTNVQPIIDLDEDKIASTTQFPLNGEWYMVIDPDAFEGTEEMFLENLGLIFTDEIREKLKAMDYNRLSVMGDEDWTLVTLLIVLSTDDEGWTESSMGFEFEFVEDKWLLVGINLMG